MKAFLITLMASFVALPALAQHGGHTMPKHASGMQQQESAADPHAGHGAAGAPETMKQTGAHAGHQMATPAAEPQASGAAGHAGHTMGRQADTSPESSSTPTARSGPGHAADEVFGRSVMEAARERLRVGQGAGRSYRLLVDRFEARTYNGRDGYLWDAQGWYGGDIDKLWLKTEGGGRFGEKTEDAEVQALWSHAITPWFDVQLGARYDFRPDPERAYAVVGLQGLVPYLFEVDAAAFLSNEGDLSARMEAEYELLLTQRLILQPRGEVSLAAQEVRELGIGSGINNVALGLRLRYEFAREFAPYVGVEWERKLGNTADFARRAGESVDDLSFVIGVRAWF